MENSRAVKNRTLMGIGLIFFIVGLVLMFSSSSAFAGLMGFGVVLFLAGFYGVRTHK